jgi:hypothetical protein
MGGGKIEELCRKSSGQALFVILCVPNELIPPGYAEYVPSSKDEAPPFL